MRMAAAFTSASSLPKRATAPSTISLTLSGLDTSTGMKHTLSPYSPPMDTVSSPPLRLRSATTTLAPSSRNLRAVARPIPDDAPVMMAVLPLSLSAMLRLSKCR